MVGVAAASAPVPPASGTDSARPSAGVEPPSQPGKARVVHGVTRPGPALEIGGLDTLPLQMPEPPVFRIAYASFTHRDLDIYIRVVNRALGPYEDIDEYGPSHSI